MSVVCVCACVLICLQCVYVFALLCLFLYENMIDGGTVRLLLHVL